jgi:hypothetical protein
MLANPKNSSHLVVLIGVVLVGSLLSACGRIQRSQPGNSDNITVEMILEPEQAVVGSANLIFMLTDESGEPINDGKLKVEGNMSHAGMAPVLGEVIGGEDGRYVVPFEWTMSGDWSVTADITLPDGKEISREFPVSVTSASGQ